MKAYKILLCSGAGMSSGFLAQAAQKAANTKAPGTKVAAKSQSLVEDVIEDYDLLLIGPHFASHKDEFDELAGQYGIPVEVIPQSVYGSLDGNGLIDFALDVLNKS